MKQIIEYLSSRGMYVMMGGFLLALGGVILLLVAKNNFWGPQVRNGALVLSLAGFVIYVIGRIFVARQRQNRKKNASTSVSQKDDL